MTDCKGIFYRVLERLHAAGETEYLTAQDIERDLTGYFGVSVRGALNRLVNAGFVNEGEFDGVRIFKLSAAQKEIVATLL